MGIVEIRGMKIGEGIPKVCVPVTGKEKEEILRETEAVRDMEPDLVEWRVDCYEESGNTEKCLEMLKEIRGILDRIPLLFTFRTMREGGNWEIDFEDYVNLLEEAAKTGFTDLIDVEIYFREERSQELIEHLQGKGVYVVASNHHFDRTPAVEEMTGRLRRMEELGADILKLAVMPETEEDLYLLLMATSKMKKESGRPIITMSMGRTGVLSRLCGECSGSAVTFAAGIRASAPGQIPVGRMRRTLQLLHESFT